MRFGADTNTRWLWFITYILLPLNVIGQTFVLFWLLDNNQGGFSLVLILAEIGFAIATILGLHQQRSWGWYCIMVMFGIQLLATPLKVHAKASMRYEVTQAANSYLQSQGRSPIRTSEPSIFDIEPMLTFFLLLVIWTAPNMIYFYRRKHLFIVPGNMDYDGMHAASVSQMVPAAKPQHGNIVTSLEEQAFSDAQGEFDNGNVRQGLMVKVTTEEPDPEKQRLLYIRYRAQQLIMEKQTLEFAANTNARNVAIKFWATHVTKQLFIAVLLFFIPVFASVGFWGGGLTGYMFSGFVLWVLYALLLLWSGSSRAWLAIPAVCVICHFLSPYSWWFMRSVSMLAAFIALPFFIAAVVRIARSRRTVASAGMGTEGKHSGRE